MKSHVLNRSYERGCQEKTLPLQPSEEMCLSCIQPWHDSAGGAVSRAAQTRPCQSMFFGVKVSCRDWLDGFGS